jgi:DNA invertase Pin-like site-specific DNA recombinase
MTPDVHQKVQATHLQRKAYLYVRQSTLRQVVENTESTQRQYALRQHAVALGWPLEHIIVIDTDLGQSGAAATDREGFQRLVTEVSLGRAGIVLGLEVSRLARNSADWHRLLEICALTDTLILDEDGVYDPAHFNDRLLLGLKGTMSEAELHVLRARLRGGILNKARRGELVVRPPIGFVSAPEGRLVIDPDQQIQQAVRLLFDMFAQTASALAVVRAFRQQGLRFPRRVPSGPHQGEIVWGELEHSQVLRVLHNPRYAGVFVYGRSRTRKTVDGRSVVESRPREQWHAFLPEAHAGYLTWEAFERNQHQLRANAQACGHDRRHSPPREGPALLQGLILCGRCGRRMTVRYHARHGRLWPEYVCQREGIEQATPICQRLPGAEIDRAVGELVLARLTPVTVDIALAVRQELQAQLDAADRLRQQHVERARYEADLAQRRYLRVDPDHRLVADSLEADWNAKLRALAAAQAEYERQRAQDRLSVDAEQQAALRALVEDLPRLWHDPSIEDRDRKRMIRLLIEDVTLMRGERITLHVRCRGGVSEPLILDRPSKSWETWMTSRDVVAEINGLLNSHTYPEIAAILNDRALRSGKGGTFTARTIARIQKHYQLMPRYDRLRAAGMLTLEEMAHALGVSTRTVHIWRVHGLVRGHAYTDKRDRLYEPPPTHAPKKAQGVKLSSRIRSRDLVPHGRKEVQCEA